MEQLLSVQVLREENALDSLPAIAIGNVDRILEIVLDLENVMGVGRLYIP